MAELPFGPARAPQPRVAAAELGLVVGEALQIQFLDDDNRGQYFVRVIGFLPERSVLVTTPMKGGEPMEQLEGRAVLARLYAGEEARGFTATILRMAEQPYPYLHLSYPTKIEPMSERQASRVRSALAATVRPGAGGAETPAVLRDLSNTGAQVLAGSPIGRAGDHLLIRARLPLEVLGDQPVDFPAVIRNVHEESEVKGSLWRYRCGVEFEPLDTQATLVLRAYLYERFAGPRN